MNSKTNTVLSKIRQTLETELKGTNLQNAELTEAEQEFIADAAALIDEAGYEMEGFDGSDPDAYAEALECVAEAEGGELAERIAEMLAPPIVEAAGPVIAEVPSDSNPSKKYQIRLGADGNVYCSCPSWKYKKEPPQDRVCKHMKGLAKQIAQVTAKMGKAEDVNLNALLAQHFTEAAEGMKNGEAFIAEAAKVIKDAGYEMENYEGATVEEMVEALLAVAAEEGEDSEVNEAVGALLAPYLDEGSGGKTYIVYVNGEEKGMIKAANHNAAEKKAQKLHPDVEPSKISVEYTEV